MKLFSNEYVSYFCLEMSMLSHAGIGIEDGLYLLAEDETDKNNKKIIEKIAENLSDGKTLADSIREVKAFPQYVGDMIETGEQTGRLEQSFKALSDYYDRQVQLNEQIKSALLYPLVLMFLMIVIIIVLLVKVLPIFNKVYEQLGGRMSGTAKFLLDFGKSLGSFMPVLSIILGVVFLLAIIVSCSKAVRGILVGFYKKLFGGIGITKKLADSRFASALAMGMMSGLHTEDAFKTAMMFGSSNKKVKKRYEDCLEMLEKGEPLADSFKENKVLDAAHCRILDLGAKSGTADTAMEEIARRIDDSVKASIERKVGRIEPTIVIITSVLVGIILVAVMLPLVNIMASIG